MSNNFHVVIPARMNSTRLPQKMVLEIDGVPLIVRTAQQAAKSNAAQVVVATDHDEIFQICQRHEIHVVMTDEKHNSGTDRIAEVAKSLALYEHEIIVNVQGDEPLIDPKIINNLAKFTFDKQANIATVARKLSEVDEIFNTNIVKVVLDKQSNALYFSRSPIPFYRNGSWHSRDLAQVPTEINMLGHIGIYAYTVGFLNEYAKLAPAPIETVEALEQLRILYDGHKIAVLVSDIRQHIGIDTLDDLQRVRNFLTKRI